MKTEHLKTKRNGRRDERGFTLVEIVLSLAVIAIAMVAIIGVLPIGLNVQAQNQEESIVSQDAAIWMEAIRGGAQGMEYLTNFVEEIAWRQDTRTLPSFAITAPGPTVYENVFPFASNIVGLLSLPKYEFNFPVSEVYERHVYADVLALNGNLADIGVDPDFAFKYRLFPELVPIQQVQTNDPNTNAVNIPFRIMSTNLYELRLTFRWPLVVQQGGGYRNQTNFRNSLTFRTLVSGVVAPVTNNLYFVQPRQFAYEFVSPPNPAP